MGAYRIYQGPIFDKNQNVNPARVGNLMWAPGFEACLVARLPFLIGGNHPVTYRLEADNDVDLRNLKNKI